MRKFTFLITGAVLAVGMTAMAAPTGPEFNLKTLPSRGVELQRQLKERMQKSSPSQASRKVAPEITNPEGYSKYYTKDQEVNYYGAYYEDIGLAAELVFGDDNNVYFGDIISDLPYSTYVKGTLEDDVITMELPQTIVYAEEQNIGYLLSLVRFDSTALDYVACEGNAEFVVFDDGTIVLDLPGDMDESYGIGVIDLEGNYMQICNTSQVYTPFDIELNVKPSDVETETYYFINDEYGFPVEVGYDSEHLYMCGMYYALKPWVPVIADLDGNQATIAQNELLGNIVGYFIVTKCAVKDGESYKLADEDAVVTLQIDRENKLITYAENSPFLVINADLERLYYVAIYEDFLLKTQDVFSGIPQNPTDLEYNDEYLDWFGYHSFLFDIPNISTDGNVLVSEDLYYRVFKNGELMEFEESGDQYIGIELTSEIPYLFNNGNDLFFNQGARREVGIYTDDATTLGVQSVYRYGDKVTESWTITMNLETGEITETAPEAGIESVSQADVISSEYFDIAGRKVTNPEKGVYLKRSVLSDGRIVTKKVLRNL